MPQFDYKVPPGTAPIVSGDQPTGEVVSEDLYYPVVEAEINPLNQTASLDVSNGFLDQRNLEALNTFKRQHVQKNTFSGGGQVGATANMDFFKDFFIGKSLAYRGTELSDSELRGSYIPIPGSGVSFYLPYKAHVLFTWNIGWFNDGPYGNPFLEVTNGSIPQLVGPSTYDGFNVSQIQLFYDTGSALIQDEVSKRKCPAGYNNFTRVSHLNSLDNGRFWGGHKLVKNMREGQHSAGLRLFAPYTSYKYDDNNPDPDRGFGHRDGIVQQTRVRVRSMRYIWFRPPEAP